MLEIWKEIKNVLEKEAKKPIIFIGYHQCLIFWDFFLKIFVHDILLILGYFPSPLCDNIG